jgi:hypothetical protein
MTATYVSASQNVRKTSPNELQIIKQTYWPREEPFKVPILWSVLITVLLVFFYVCSEAEMWGLRVVWASGLNPSVCQSAGSLLWALFRVQTPACVHLNHSTAHSRTRADGGWEHATGLYYLTPGVSSTWNVNINDTAVSWYHFNCFSISLSTIWPVVKNTIENHCTPFRSRLTDSGRVRPNIKRLIILFTQCMYVFMILQVNS